MCLKCFNWQENLFESILCLKGENYVNSLPASKVFCHLLITYEKDLDLDQSWQNVWLDLYPNCLTLMDFVKDFFFNMRFLDLSQSPESRPTGYKTFFILNSTEHEISTAHKN